MGNRGRGQGKLARMAMRYAWRQLEAMTGKHEAYLNHAKYLPETYSTGTVSAERPDADMKDAVLAHAFKTKEDKAQKTVDTE